MPPARRSPARRIPAVLSLASLLALTALVSPTSIDSASGAEVVTVPASITANCTRDVSGELNTFLARVPNGSTVNFPAGACYRVDRTVTVSGKTGLVLAGHGARLQRLTPTPHDLSYPNANPILRLGRLTRSRVVGFKILGINMRSNVPHHPEYGTYYRNWEFDHGIAISGGVDLTVKRVTIDGPYGDGIWVGGDDKWSYRRSDGVRLLRITVKHNGRQGIALTRGTNILVDRSNITSRRAGIDLEPAATTHVLKNVEIRRSQFNSHLLAFSGSGAGVVNNVNIHHNLVTHTGTPFVHAGSSSGLSRNNWRIANNTVTWTLGSSSPGVRLMNMHNVTVEGNHLRFSAARSMQGVRVMNGTNGVSVTCNWFRNATTVVGADATSTFTARANKMGPTAPTCTS